MAKIKNTAVPVKRKYVKKSKAHWGKLKKKNTAKSAETDSPFIDVILQLIDRLSITDKAKVFAHILGAEIFDERQLWAIQKIAKG